MIQQSYRQRKELAVFLLFLLLLRKNSIEFCVLQQGINAACGMPNSFRIGNAPCLTFLSIIK